MSRADLINDYHEQIEDLILTEEIENVDTLHEFIFQMINDDENVIYTYKAKEISKLIGDYDAFDTSDMTGERFDNWGQVAFENIYHLIYENIDIDLVLEKMNT